MAEPRHFDELSPEEQKEVLALARAQFAPMNTPSVADKREEGTYVPPALTRGYTALIEPVTEVLARVANPLLHTLTEPLVTGTRIAQEGSLRPLIQEKSPLASALPLSRAVAKAVIPQTPTEAGMLLGTAGIGRAVRGASQFRQAAGRVVGSAAGGELGNQIEGGATGQGLALGAGLGALGEGIGAVGSKLARSLPGAKTRIAEQDAAALGRRLGAESPALQGAKTSSGLHEMAAGGGRAALGSQKESAVQEIERRLGGKLLDVPALGPTPLSLRDANRQMSEIGAKAFSKNPLDRTILGVDQRKLYGEIEGQIEQSLGRVGGPEAKALFQQTQRDYKQGITLLRHLLERPDAFRSGPKGVELNTPVIQKMLMNPKTRAALTNKLGADGFERIVDTVTRGGGLGTQDILAGGSGGFGTLAGQMFRGRNTGFNAPILAAGTAALPNVGSRYAGRQPYALTSGQQTALDLLMQRLAAQASITP